MREWTVEIRGPRIGKYTNHGLPVDDVWGTVDNAVRGAEAMGLDIIITVWRGDRSKYEEEEPIT